MATIIFFGGLVTGFLIGWIGMALLTMASMKNREQELFQTLVYSEPNPPPHEDSRDYFEAFPANP